jgi:hypothetical protein
MRRALSRTTHASAPVIRSLEFPSRLGQEITNE